MKLPQINGSWMFKCISKRILVKNDTSFSFAFTAAIRVIGVVLRFVVVVAFSRQIGAEQFGVYSYVTQLVAMIALISFFGADQYLLKVIPRSIRARQEERMRQSMSSVAIIALVSSSFAVLSLVLTSQTTALIPHTYVVETVLGSLMVFPMLFLFFQNAVFRANHFPVSSQVCENIIYPVLMLFSFFVLVWWAGEQNLRVTAYMVVIITIINYFLVAALGLLLLHRKVRIAPVISLKNIFITFRELAPLCIFVILYQLFSRLPILTVGHSLGATELARYFAASRVAELIEFPLGILSIVYVSKYSELSVHEQDKKQRILRKASIILLLSSVLIYAVLYGLSDHIFRLFGEGMTESQEVYVVLGLGYTVASATGFVDFALIRAGHSTMVNLSLLLSIVVMTVLLIGLNISTPREVALIYAFSWIINKFLMVYWLWSKQRLLALPLMPIYLTDKNVK